MQKEQTNRNIILQACEGENYFGHTQFVHEHVLGLITSGVAEHYTPDGVTIYSEGTLCLFRRTQLMKTIKKPAEGKPFTTINIFLSQEILKRYSLEHQVKADRVYLGESNVILENDAFMKGYFNSLLPYFAQPEKLTPTLEYAKTIEAIELLLRNPALKNYLFDFSEPHKIDLEAYMNRYFSYNIPLAQFAKLTGRSLSSFKRDFDKIFRSTPEKWLQKQRLEHAHFLMKQKNKRPSEIYLEVGFESFSHFSHAFKKQFGITPTELHNK
ncbi:helix-turn-helix transcriptional regulator [Dyadobacter flavalbus]|uniref:Helix-turn-helix transcriptional regulator n=1 Tax=Dyadobacter flavalbus TaxID=2579942 RepID=A0A5M8QT15_9BACT|nr:AraC family transcriptional regulator [Dyadobacter flavalbus]KAA6438418.1 helix-turn-helix transcriptional regulator [Dyadobacter flavalbus]